MANFKSVLEAVGSDVKKVFAWVGSAQGQTIIQTGEAVAEAVYPPATGIISLANTYLSEAIKTEALAAGAAQQNGSGTQKLAAVVAAVTPQALAFAAQNGYPAPSAAQIQTQANAIVAFLNSFQAA